MNERVHIQTLGKVGLDRSFDYPSTNPPEHFEPPAPVPGAKRMVTDEYMQLMKQSLDGRGIRLRDAAGGGALNATIHGQTVLGTEGTMFLSTAIGPDAAGDIVRRELEKQGVFYSDEAAEVTPVSLVLAGLNPKGDRETRLLDPDYLPLRRQPIPDGNAAFWINSLGNGWRQTFAEIMPDLPDRLSVGLTLGTAALDKRRELSGDAELVREFVERANYIAQNYEEAERILVLMGEMKQGQQLPPEKVAEKLSRRGRAKTVLVSDGPNGAYLANSEEGVVYHGQTIPVPDGQKAYTIGAGDSAAATGIIEWRQGSEPEAILAAAIASGSHAVLYPHAHEGGLSRTRLKERLTLLGQDFNITKVSSEEKIPRVGTGIMSLAAAAALMRRT